MKEYQEAAEKYLLRNSVYSREEVRTVLKEIFDDNTGLKSAHSTAEFLQLLNQFPSENSKRMVEEEQEFFEDLIADLKKILCIENIMCDDNTVAFSLNKGQLPHIFGNNEVTDQENLDSDDANSTMEEEDKIAPSEDDNDYISFNSEFIPDTPNVKQRPQFSALDNDSNSSSTIDYFLKSPTISKHNAEKEENAKSSGHQNFHHLDTSPTTQASPNNDPNSDNHENNLETKSINEDDLDFNGIFGGAKTKSVAKISKEMEKLNNIATDNFGDCISNKLPILCESSSLSEYKTKAMKVLNEFENKFDNNSLKEFLSKVEENLIYEALKQMYNTNIIVTSDRLDTLFEKMMTEKNEKEFLFLKNPDTWAKYFSPGFWDTFCEKVDQFVRKPDLEKNDDSHDESSSDVEENDDSDDKLSSNVEPSNNTNINKQYFEFIRCNENEDFSCEICHETLPTLDGIYAHIRRFHEEKATPIKSKKKSSSQQKKKMQDPVSIQGCLDYIHGLANTPCLCKWCSCKKSKKFKLVGHKGENNKCKTCSLPKKGPCTCDRENRAEMNAKLLKEFCLRQQNRLNKFAKMGIKKWFEDKMGQPCQCAMNILKMYPTFKGYVPVDNPGCGNCLYNR